MFRVFLDIPTLAVPDMPASQSLSSSKARFEEYVLRLLQIDEARRKYSAQLFLPRGAEKTLFEASLYPLWDSLKLGLERSELTENYEAKDIVAVVNGFLKQLPRIEDTLGIEDALIEDAQIDPDEYLKEFLPVIADAHKQFLILVAVLFYTTARNKCGDYVVTDINEGGVVTTSIAGRIVDWALSEQSGCSKIALPLPIDDTISVCNGWQSIGFDLRSIDIWREATCRPEYEFAFSIYLMQFCRNNGIAQGKGDWHIGTQFINSAYGQGFLNDKAKIERLLAKMAETVVGLNLPQTHQLREDIGGSAHQKMRGKDAAWRRDLDYEFHLHYWKTIHGTEFASVVIHNDFSIPS